MNNVSDYRETDERIERGNSEDEVFSVPVKAGKRIYYFDVKATRYNEYYITITESRKRLNRDGSFTIDKHKLHIYKEDFAKFRDGFKEVLEYIERQQPETWSSAPTFETLADGQNLPANDLVTGIPTEEEFFQDLDLA